VPESIPVAFYGRGAGVTLADEPFAEEGPEKSREQAPTFKGGPHKARHTFASHFLRARPDLFLLGRVLGRSHSRVTELYGHLLPDHLAEARNVEDVATPRDKRAALRMPIRESLAAC
jgi:hypothetical protein